MRRIIPIALGVFGLLATISFLYFLMPRGTEPSSNVTVSPVRVAGANLTERFDITLEDGQTLLPGMVVCVDRTGNGKLRLCTAEYDKSVVGIVAGAGGIEPGVVMAQPGSLASGNHAVALSGRAYCLIDTTSAAIESGDLLTTSNVPGYAMKAADRARALGATIGKALAPVEKDSHGLVLVLISLQ